MRGVSRWWKYGYNQPIESVGWRWRPNFSQFFLILLFTKPNIKVSGRLNQTKTHITHILYQPNLKVRSAWTNPLTQGAPGMPSLLGLMSNNTNIFCLFRVNVIQALSCLPCEGINRCAEVSFILNKRRDFRQRKLWFFFIFSLRNTVKQDTGVKTVVVAVMCVQKEKGRLAVESGVKEALVHLG